MKKLVKTIDNLMFKNISAIGLMLSFLLFVKDNIGSYDSPTSVGTLAVIGSQPVQDAFLVERLRSVGALIMGKTAMDELAIGARGISSRSGRTGNAFNANKNPGGSSGGSAASVSANFSLGSIGTDNSGSIRFPAAYNGIYGLRPSTGLVSQRGGFPIGRKYAEPTLIEIAYAYDVHINPRILPRMQTKTMAPLDIPLMNNLISEIGETTYQKGGEDSLTGERFREIVKGVLSEKTVRRADPRSVVFPYDVGESNLWSEMTISDLEDVYHQLKENSPIPLDDEHPRYREWLEKGYQEARKLAESVTDYGGYMATLGFYAGGFQDSHIRVVPKLEYSEILWTGFLATYEQGKFLVGYIDGAQGFKLGDEIVEVNGVPIRKFLLEGVLKYDQAVLPLEGHWNWKAAELFLDKGNPFIVRPESCLIRSDGKLKNIELQWKKVNGCMVKELAESLRAIAHTEFEMRKILGGKGVWVSLPSFYLQSDEQIEKIQSVMNQVPTLRELEVIVVDVRGNSGGNSNWGTEFLERLYGEEFVSDKLDHLYAKYYTEYRVSPENIAYFESVIALLIKQHGENSEAVLHTQSLIENMKQTLKDRGNVLMRSEVLEEESPFKSITPLFKGRLFLLTDYSCSSACLDFVDQTLSMPNVIHVGLPTGGDTEYLEVRMILLPSKNASIVVPTKVTRNRNRKNNEVYQPLHRYPGSIKETPEIEKWIDGLVP